MVIKLTPDTSPDCKSTDIWINEMCQVKTRNELGHQAGQDCLIQWITNKDTHTKFHSRRRNK